MRGLHAKMWERLAVLIVQPWRTPALKLTANLNYPGGFFFSPRVSLGCDESLCRGNTKALCIISALEVLNLKIWSLCLFCLYHRVWLACHCRCWHCVPPQMRLTQFSMTASHKFIFKVRRQELRYRSLCNTSYLFSSALFQAGAVGGNVGGKIPRLLCSVLKVIWGEFLFNFGVHSANF